MGRGGGSTCSFWHVNGRGVTTDNSFAISIEVSGSKGIEEASHSHLRGGRGGEAAARRSVSTFWAREDQWLRVDAWISVREASVRVQSSGVPPGSGARSRCGVRSSPDLGVERKRRAPCTSRRGGGRVLYRRIRTA